MPRLPLTLLLFSLLAAGCRDGTGPGTGRAFVQSDPPGARILVDGRSTNRITPDTIHGLNGQHELIVALDSGRWSYRYGARINVSDDSIASVNGPVVLRCGRPSCYRDLRASPTPLFESYRLSINALGTFFLEDGTADGLTWPFTTNNSYVSTGMPMFAARLTNGDTVALGIYDLPFLAGRPVPPPVRTETELRATQSPWVIPPSNMITLSTVRGLRLDQHLVAVPEVPDAIGIRLVVHNISADPLYMVTDPLIPEGGLTYENAWIGYGLDVDIGNAADDMMAYAPSDNMVFAYDWGWEEPNFQGPARTAPGLVGLVVLETEPGTAHVLNGWRNVSGETPDWGGGRSNEFRGLGMMSGRNPYAPAHTDPGIGHTPESPGDVRLLISSGPFVLAPGDSASMTLAVVIAEPIPGTFTVGLGTPPGNPRDPDRAILEIAAGLLERARAARDLLPLFVQNDEGEASAPLHAARRGRND